MLSKHVNMKNGNMKKAMKIRALGICCIVFVLHGCYTPPKEKFKDKENGALVVQAENNLLGIYDNWATYCQELDEDSYGRKMYVFWGESEVNKKSLPDGRGHVWAILIQQKIEGEYVYYYDDISYIMKESNLSFNIWEKNDRFISETIGSLSDSEINKLKEENDWDKEYNDEKMTKKLIMKYSKHYKRRIVDEKRQKEVYENNFPSKYPHPWRFVTYLTSDDYGRYIYFCRTVDENGVFDSAYLIMFYGAESYKILEISDIWDYRDEIIEFKRDNNWGKPVE